MFGKNKPPPTSNQLSERMRRAVERPTAPTPAFTPPTHPARSARHAVFRQGTVVLPDGERLSVAIKNLSESGARIEYFVRRELPHFVVLIESTLRIKHRARVVWQRDGAAGLAFNNE
jgi:hypothetical protein